MEDPQTRGGFKKLYSEPVEISIYTAWKPKEGSTPDNPDFEPNPETEIKCFMHPMTDDEVWDAEAVGVEAYRSFRLKGGNPEDSIWKSDRVEKCQQLFYILRTGKEKNAPRLFETEGEVARLFPKEVDRVIKLYAQTFVPTGEEIKNSLRERLGQL